MPLYLTLHGI